MGKTVDQTAIKVNQASLIALVLVGFLLDRWVPVAFTAAVLAVGTLWPGAALFRRVYQHLLLPAGILRSRVIPDDPAPHNFAQGVGAAFLGASTIALLAGSPVLGWVLAWIVIVLAAINLFFGFCAGCYVYLQLDRLGVWQRTPS